VRLTGHALDIGAGAEPSSGSSDNHDPDSVVEPQPGEIVAKALTHIDVQRIELFRTVQYDLRDRTLNGQINRHTASSDEISIYSSARMAGKIVPSKP